VLTLCLIQISKHNIKIKMTNILYKKLHVHVKRTLQIFFVVNILKMETKNFVLNFFLYKIFLFNHNHINLNVLNLMKNLDKIQLR